MKQDQISLPGESLARQTSRFLFWNLGKKDLRSLINRAVRENDVDIIILAECMSRPEEILSGLNQDITRFHYAFGVCESIGIYAAFPRKFIRPVSEGARFTMRRIQLPLREEILLVAAHLPSKLHWRDESQKQEVISLADDIRSAEVKRKHRRTVLVGDFNMQPFEDGMTGAKGLHGVMSRQVANRGSRIVQEREYPFFYNPMWSMMGDLSQGPPGSYFYESAGHVEHYWWMFDQVLIRPELVNKTRNDGFRFLTMIGKQSLVDGKGRPDSKVGSDHLPLYFEVDF